MNSILLKRVGSHSKLSYTGGSVAFRRCFSKQFLNISREVESAVLNKLPVVALETTIYTHGFPYPDNVALASHLESVVRLNGGVPATIGVLHGVARVGLNPEELIELASSAGKTETMKVSRRDIPFITGLGMVGEKLNGGTTVAGTMVLAHLAGISVFGTGGLGGVHRGGEHTMDISADLTELGRTPVAVISSGCKSFLDIPRTMEYLETQGVGVSTFADGRIGNIDLPAFWTRESGVRSPSVVQDEKEAAAIIYARKGLCMNSGLFFANPIPSEYSLPKSKIDQAIEEAVQDAERQSIHGYANTPFILERIRQLTQGKSILANRALIESNVARATKVAVELSNLVSRSGLHGSTYMTATYQVPQPSKASHFPKATATATTTTVVGDFIEPNPRSNTDILVAGSVAMDFSCDYAPLGANTSGVGHNVATAAHLVGGSTSVRLCSVVADDLAGKIILSSMRERRLDISAISTLKMDVKNPEGTPQYVAVNDGGKELVMAMADMRIINSPRITISQWKSTISEAKAKWVVVDANWNEALMFQWVKEAKRAGASVAFEPVSVEKSSKLFPPIASLTTEEVSENAREGKGVFPTHDLELATPNEQELMAIHSAASTYGYLERQDWWKVIDTLGISSSGVGFQLRDLTSPELVDKGIPQRMIQLLPFMPTIITKLGARGVLMAMLLPKNHHLLQSPEGAPYVLSRNLSGDPHVGGVYIRLFPAAETVRKEDVVSVNGVGDTFLGVVVAGLAKGLELDEGLIQLAQKASVMTLKSKEAVSPEIAGLGVELERLCREKIMDFPKE